MTNFYPGQEIEVLGATVDVQLEAFQDKVRFPKIGIVQSEDPKNGTLSVIFLNKVYDDQSNSFHPQYGTPEPISTNDVRPTGVHHSSSWTGDVPNRSHFFNPNP